MLLPEGLLLIAGSLTESIYFSYTYRDHFYVYIDVVFVLDFLYQLKKAETLKWLACALWIGVHIYPFTWPCSRTEFYQFLFNRSTTLGTLKV